MKKSDLIIMSMGNLWRRKLRTLLTLMGVVIGTASIIIMISLGVGMKKSIEESLKELGSLNIVSVSKEYSWERGGDAKDSSGKKKNKILLNDEAVQAMSMIPGVTVISPVKTMEVRLRHGKYYAYATLTGVKRELLEKQNLKLEKGTLFDESVRNSFVFGAEIPYQFKNPKSNTYGEDYGGFYFEDPSQQNQRPAPKVDVMEDAILLNPDYRYGQPGIKHEEKQTIPRPTKIEVAGLTKRGNFRVDYNIFTSLESFNKIEADYNRWKKKHEKPGQNGENRPSPEKNKREKEYNQVEIFVEKIDDIPAVQDEIRKMGFRAQSMYETVKEVGNFANIAQMVLGGIGGVSLIVAAIGISNTMVMSIYERTKEIGVMKVIGASLRDIQGMFLTEAALIGLFGGVVGLVISKLGSMLINFLTKGVNIFGGGSFSGETPPLSIIPLWLYLLGIVFTTFVGLLSGYLPARRAMNLSVLKALRNE